MGLRGTTVALTFGLATASFYLVEQPIRRGALRRRWAFTFSPSAFVATGAVVVFATAGATAPPAYLQSGPNSILTSAPKEQIATAAPAPPAPPAPPPAAAAEPGATAVAPPRRILLVGDSLAVSLLPGLKAAAAEQGVELFPAPVSGCSVIGGQPLSVAGTPFSFADDCEKNIPTYQERHLAAVRPDVVVWLSTWDRLDRLVNGRRASPATIEGRSVFTGLIDEAAARLTSTGARLIILTVAPPAPSELVPDPPEDKTIDHMNRLLREYARAHADRVALVDLAAILCPNGPPCPETIDGIRPRYRDGNHFESDTTGWMGRKVMPQVMAAGPGSGTQTIAAPVATINASVGDPRR